VQAAISFLLFTLKRCVEGIGAAIEIALLNLQFFKLIIVLSEGMVLGRRRSEDIKTVGLNRGAERVNSVDNQVINNQD
jgi:hypothetical protein